MNWLTDFIGHAAVSVGIGSIAGLKKLSSGGSKKSPQTEIEQKVNHLGARSIKAYLLTETAL